MTLETISVEAAAQGSWYDEYRHLRHRVFVVEQGWQGLSSSHEAGLTRSDPADTRARFWLARSTTGALVGAVRICRVQHVFPHEDLFAGHLAVPAIGNLRPRLGTLNSLVVDRQWRRRLCATRHGATGTVCRLLLDACVIDSAGAGMAGILTTAQTLISALALVRAGFRILDGPNRTALHPRFAMCNLGIVLDHAGPHAPVAVQYFEDRHHAVLAAGSLAAQFDDATAPAAGAA